MSLEVPDPLNFTLSAETLLAAGATPIVAGDDWTLRFQVRDIAGPVSLAGVQLICMTWRKDRFSTTSQFTRRSDTNIPSTSIKQIAADTNQATEELDADGEVVGGIGWFEIRGSDEDAAVLLAAVGLPWYDIRIKFGDGNVRTILQGEVECIQPGTEPMV